MDAASVFKAIADYGLAIVGCVAACWVCYKLIKRIIDSYEKQINQLITEFKAFVDRQTSQHNVLSDKVDSMSDSIAELRTDVDNLASTIEAQNIKRRTK